MAQRKDPKTLYDADLRDAIDEEGLRYALINYYGFDREEKLQEIKNWRTRELVRKLVAAIDALESHLGV